MPRKLSILVLLALALAPAAAFAGCGGDSNETSAVEGQPLELGDLLYNVQLTRFLNPAAPEDSAYLKGQPAPPPGQDYLAVFMRIQNESDEQAQQVPSSFTIQNIRDQVFDPIRTDNPFALDLGSEIPPGGQIPSIDTPAFSGPIKGSMVLYLIDETAAENRPLELQIPGPNGETGTIELDI